MHPGNLSISDFTYTLPEEKIALHPLPERDSSKLLVYRNGIITDSIFKNISNYIPANSLILINNTRVVHARMLFQKESGARIELFCLEPANGSYAETFSSVKACSWLCLIGNSKRWKESELSKTIFYKNTPVKLTARQTGTQNGQPVIEFSWDNPDITFAALLEIAGKLPLPPYLHREVSDQDEEVYQTTYAREEGSVAAPTAGLHFTPTVFESLKNKNIQVEELTLHVGAGTFLPVKADTMNGHQMHRECFSITRQLIESLLLAAKQNKPILATGTTTLRTLESLYWAGINPEISNPSVAFEVNQWDPYQNLPETTPENALRVVLRRMDNAGTDELTGYTSLIIAPGYKPKLASGIITNFHQPGSTLLLLVAALTGDNWKSIYNHALQSGYRFLSFGDSSLLLFES